MWERVNAEADKVADSPTEIGSGWFSLVLEDLDNLPMPALEVVRLALSVGDFLDRYSILLLKLTRLPAKNLSGYIIQKTEYDEAFELFRNHTNTVTASLLLGFFIEVNADLWDLETAARKTDTNEELGSIYRRVQKVNNVRGALKLEVDKRFGSAFLDKNQYHDGSRQDEDTGNLHD